MGNRPVTGLWFAVALIAGSYGVAVLEEWSSTGSFRPAAPLQAGAALLARGPAIV